MVMKAEIKNSFRWNLLIIFLICVALYILFFTSLGWVTHHGDETKVPMEVGKDVSAAMTEMRAQGFDVRVDSAYEPEVKPYMVLSQQPEANTVVKYGRILFLTVNKAEPPKTAMPNLIGLSFHSAALILKSNRLVLGDTSYRPDIAKGTILDQVFNGKRLKPGEIIPQGSRINLVIGDGLGQTEMNVPDLIGQSYYEAMASISAMGLQANAIWEGMITDSASAIVYNQQPKSVNELQRQIMIHEGDIVDILIKQSPTQEEIDNNKGHQIPVNTDTLK